MKIESLKPGMIVYDVSRERMGNTMMRTICVREVQIKEVDVENGQVIASWNHNRPQIYRGRTFLWKLKKPLLIKCGWAERPATRAEIKAMKDAK